MHSKTDFPASIPIGYPQSCQCNLTITTFAPQTREHPSGNIGSIGLPTFSLSEPSAGPQHYWGPNFQSLGKCLISLPSQTELCCHLWSAPKTVLPFWFFLNTNTVCLANGSSKFSCHFGHSFRTQNGFIASINLSGEDQLPENFKQTRSAWHPSGPTWFFGYHTTPALKRILFIDHPSSWYLWMENRNC